MVLIDSEHVVHADVGHPATSGDTRPTTPSKGRGLFFAALQFAASALLILGGTTLLGTDASMWLRTTAVCAGLVVGYRGLRSATQVIVGRPVDMALVLSVGWVVTVVLAALLAPILPLGEASNSGATLDVPRLLRPDLFSEHPLGTNNLSLDMLSRVVWGARQSLATALVAIVLSTIVGGMIGLIAGYCGGWVDRVTRVGTNAGLAFPPLVLLLVLAAIFGHSAMGVAFALAILSVASLVRIARAQAVGFAAREYTYVARILGGTRWQVLRREVLPPVAMSLVSFAFLTVPLLIVAEAALGYLGLGVRPPSPTWGNMIAEAGNGGLETSPHLALVPGVVLVVTVFSLNLIGQRIRAKWDRG